MAWRERRRLSYLMHDKFDDSDLPYIVLDMTDQEIEDMVLGFFATESKLIYPAKSYFVAFIYAKLLTIHFDISFLEALDTDDLLIDDPAFTPYRKKKELYDNIAKKLPSRYWELPSAAATTKYFKEEFLIEEAS